MSTTTSTDHISSMSSNPQHVTTATTMTMTTMTNTTTSSMEESMNTRLETLREIARVQATAKHAEIKARRKQQPSQEQQQQQQQQLLMSSSKKPRKELTKRQLSSKRSAEICRIKSQIYTELLEHAVCTEENERSQLQTRLHLQMQENLNLANRIAEIAAANAISPSPSPSPPSQQQYQEKQEQVQEQEQHQHQHQHQQHQQLILPPSVTPAFESVPTQGNSNPGLSSELNLDDFMNPSAIHIQVQLTKKEIEMEQEEDAKFMKQFMLDDDEITNPSLSPVTEVSHEPTFPNSVPTPTPTPPTRLSTEQNPFLVQ